MIVFVNVYNRSKRDIVWLLSRKRGSYSDYNLKILTLSSYSSRMSSFLSFKVLFLLNSIKVALLVTLPHSWLSMNLLMLSNELLLLLKCQTSEVCLLFLQVLKLFWCEIFKLIILRVPWLSVLSAHSSYLI